MLATWFVLLGGALPGLACAAATRDCCPDDASVPCTETNPSEPTAAAEACCAVAPSPAQATSVAPVRVELETLTVSGSPDPSIASSPMSGLAQPAPHRDGASIIANPAVRDGSSTYLRTLRLRL
jgi:hypothetical protein